MSNVSLNFTSRAAYIIILKKEQLQSSIEVDGWEIELNWIGWRYKKEAIDLIICSSLDKFDDWSSIQRDGILNLNQSTIWLQEDGGCREIGGMDQDIKGVKTLESVIDHQSSQDRGKPFKWLLLSPSWVLTASASPLARTDWFRDFLARCRVDMEDDGWADMTHLWRFLNHKSFRPVTHQSSASCTTQLKNSLGLILLGSRLWTLSQGWWYITSPRSHLITWRMYLK